MKIISINVGLPQKIMWDGKEIETSIFKYPVSESVTIEKFNIIGDKQSDLKAHGGENKAIYGYSANHYEFWKKELPEVDFPFGIFGENLTVEDLDENEINIGDLFQLGTAQIMAVQPRFPCYKLSARFKRSDMVKRFLESKLSGIYFKVIEEGKVSAGENLKLIKKDQNNIKISEITRVSTTDKDDVEAIQRIIDVKKLPERLRQRLKEKL